MDAASIRQGIADLHRAALAAGITDPVLFMSPEQMRVLGRIVGWDVEGLPVRPIVQPNRHERRKLWAIERRRPIGAAG